MVLRIAKKEEYKDKVTTKTIHGKYPYKLYLELIGNSNLGKHIVVVSDKPISNGTDKVNEVAIKSNIKAKKTNIVKPNTTTNGYFISYSVKESNVVSVGDEKIFVFEILGK